MIHYLFWIVDINDFIRR